jgi:hypothetical protein
MLSPVACPALQYFSTLSHKRGVFREKIIEHKMLDFDFSTNLSETFLILIRTERDMITNVHTIKISTCCPCQVSMKLEFP